MPETTWNPPTGPPYGGPLRPGEARRELYDEIDAARARDHQLRTELAAYAAARARADDRLVAVTDDAAEARSLAKRALTRSNQSARDGQRADAARLTGAARVFALRLRCARAEAAEIERQLAAAADQEQRTEADLAENVRRLQAIAAARLPALAGRKAARAERDLEAAVAALSVPVDELIAQASEAARAAEVDDRSPAEGEGVSPVTDEDLESEVDFEGADEVLDELRAELGLVPPAEQPDPSRAPAAGSDRPVHAARR